MDLPDKFRVDRTVIEVTTLDAVGKDRPYWMSKSPEERLEALEFMRQIAYGYDPATERLQRVLEVVRVDWR